MKQLLLVPVILALAYANIDLKYTRFYVRDGGNNTVLTGTINAGSLTVGTTTITTAGFVGAVATGGKIQLGSRFYLITAHAETTGNTTSITIAAPGLAVAIINGQAVTAFGVQNSVEIVIGNGNLTYDENRNMVYTQNRGLLDDVKEGDQVPVDVSFQFNWDYIKGGATIPSIEDALKKQNLAAAWVSSDTDGCKPYSVDLVIEYTPNCVGADLETIILSDYRYEKLAHDPKNAQVSSSGKCNITRATVIRG